MGNNRSIPFGVERLGELGIQQVLNKCTLPKGITEGNTKYRGRSYAAGLTALFLLSTLHASLNKHEPLTSSKALKTHLGCPLFWEAFPDCPTHKRQH